MKIPVGLDSNSKQIRFIDDVARGLECDCICASCGSQLIARKGKIKVAHFAHYQNQETKACRETAIHLMAKHALLQQSNLVVPYIKIASNTETSLLNEPYQEYQEFCTKPCTVRDLIDEVWLPDYRFQPDVMCRIAIDGYLRRLAIEIAVTHKVDEDKLSKILHADINTVEIDLSDLVRQNNVTYQDVCEAVKMRERMKWIHISVDMTNALKLKLNADNQALVARRNDEIGGWYRDVTAVVLSSRHFTLPDYPFTEQLKRATITDKIGRTHQLVIDKAPRIGGVYKVVSISTVKDCQLTLVIEVGARYFDLPIVLVSENGPEALPTGSYLKLVGEKLPEADNFVNSLAWGRSLRAEHYIDIYNERAAVYLSRINDQIDQDIKKKLAELDNIKASEVKPECNNINELEKAYQIFSLELESRGFNVDMIITDDIEDSWIFGCPEKFWQVILFRTICYINNETVDVEFYHKQLKSQFKIDAVEPIRSLTFLPTNEKLPSAYGVLVKYFKFLANIGALSWARGRYRKNLPYGSDYRNMR